MNSAPGNAQRLPGMDLDWLSVDRPGQHSLHPVDRLFIMVVAMSGSHQSGPTRHGEFEGCNAACRVVAGDEEVDPEWSQRDHLLGRIDAVLEGFLRHLRSPQTLPVILLLATQILGHIAERPRASSAPRRTRVHRSEATSLRGPAH